MRPGQLLERSDRSRVDDRGSSYSLLMPGRGALKTKTLTEEECFDLESVTLSVLRRMKLCVVGKAFPGQFRVVDGRYAERSDRV